MITRYKSSADKRKARIRGSVVSSNREYRLVVRKSNKYMYAQVIKSATGKTLFGVKGRKAEEVGKAIAKKSGEAKISEIVFDRGESRYHGNIKLLADAAREAGLKF